MLRARVITALVLVALLLATLFWLPSLMWSLLMVVMVTLGASEWTRLAGLSGRSAQFYIAGTLLSMLALAGLNVGAPESLNSYVHLGLYLLSALLWLIVVPSWLISGWRTQQPVLLGGIGWVVLVPTGIAMMDLREAAPSPWILLGVMGLVWVADISAYFAGRRFGKNKLAPSISPGKTWEGVAGAIVGVSVYVALIWGLNPQLISRAILPALLLTSWWWVVLAVIGDLFESALKRQAGVKDSGTLLPGHGGILDRIDALTSTLPLAALALMFQGVA